VVEEGQAVTEPTERDRELAAAIVEDSHCRYCANIGDGAHPAMKCLYDIQQHQDEVAVALAQARAEGYAQGHSDGIMSEVARSHEYCKQAFEKGAKAEREALRQWAASQAEFIGDDPDLHFVGDIVDYDTLKKWLDARDKEQT
jgi:hypothetical protein